MFEQIILPYATDALEPVLDKETIETHYGKHHATYTKNFNEAAKRAGLVGKGAGEILLTLNTVENKMLRTSLRNNGGGYFNHNLYFSILSPNPTKEPTGALAQKIEETFGGFNELKIELSKLAVSQFGSGWAWLSANHKGELKISTSPNQDNPIIEGMNMMPILAIDVWEHAYYLKYKNLRPDYIDALWEIIDWDKVSGNYDGVIK